MDIGRDRQREGQMEGGTDVGRAGLKDGEGSKGGGVKEERMVKAMDEKGREKERNTQSE